MAVDDTTESDGMKDPGAADVSEDMTDGDMRDLARELIAGGMIAALTSEVGKLAKAIDGLEATWRTELGQTNASVEALARASRRDRVAGAAGALFVVMALAYALVTLNRLDGISQINRENARTLIECTTPTPAGSDRRHVCYEESRAFSVGLTLAIVQCSGLPHEASPAERRECVATAIASADTAEVTP